jgi:ribonuclease Z
MSWDVRVLTAPSLDTELCLLVTFDNAKYLINCGEGTQRNFVQKKISLRKLDGVFLTNGSAACIGGLPGKGVLSFVVPSINDLISTCRCNDDSG